MDKNIVKVESEMLAVGFVFEDATIKPCIVENNSASDSSTPQIPLSEDEKKSLKKYESTIEKGKAAFLEVGNALREIKVRKLYRAKYKTFDQYCESVWGFCRVNANRYIDAVRINEILGSLPNGEVHPLTSVSQARPFSDVPMDKIVEVAKKAKEIAGNCEPTIKDIENAKKKVCPPKERKAPSKHKTDEMSLQTHIIKLVTEEDKDFATLSDTVEYARDLVKRGATKEEIEKELDEALELIQFFARQVYKLEEAT